MINDTILANIMNELTLLNVNSLSHINLFLFNSFVDKLFDLDF